MNSSQIRERRLLETPGNLPCPELAHTHSHPDLHSPDLPSVNILTQGRNHSTPEAAFQPHPILATLPVLPHAYPLTLTPSVRARPAMRPSSLRYELVAPHSGSYSHSPSFASFGDLGEGENEKGESGNDKCMQKDDPFSGSSTPGSASPPSSPMEDKNVQPFALAQIHGDTQGRADVRQASVRLPVKEKCTAEGQGNVADDMYMPGGPGEMAQSARDKQGKMARQEGVGWGKGSKEEVGQAGAGATGAKGSKGEGGDVMW